MLIDLASAGSELLSDSGTLRAEVCIVGGGIAGLVLANRLADHGIDVVLLEAGGRGLLSDTARAHAEVELTGEPHVGSREGRPLGLGGSSVVWGGQLLPILPGGNWPVSAEELGRFDKDIEDLLRVDDLPFTAEAFLKERGQPKLSMLDQLPRLVARMSKFAPFATRHLGRSLGVRMSEHPRTRLVLHAHVTALKMDAGKRVRSVQLRTPGGNAFEISADFVVLAAGTVETCRLLLASSVHEGADAARGVGNLHGQVGRGFHDHLTVEVARFQGESRGRALELFRPWLVGGARGTLHALKLEAHNTFLRRFGLNPVLAHVTFEEPEASGAAVLRAILLARQKGESRFGGDWRSLPAALRDAWRFHRDAMRNGRRYVSAQARIGLRINVAQEIPGRSLIGLSEQQDAWGRPLARVHWEYAASDLRTIRFFAGYLRRRFRQLGFEGLQWNPESLPLARRCVSGMPGLQDVREMDRPLPGVEDARHAMGGARMGTDPQTSVVDANLKVHGVDNLYVASAAVFPDGRAHLPTMTLMALTLRLAEHLRSASRRAG